MPAFQPFVMEQMMSEWENAVDINLSESGVHPMTLGELLAWTVASRATWPTSACSTHRPTARPELRERIAALYDGATKDDVLVTIGAAEANYLAITTFLEPGDEIVLVLPNYMQIWGVAVNRGLQRQGGPPRRRQRLGARHRRPRCGRDPGHEDDRGVQPQQPHGPDHVRGGDGGRRGRGRPRGGLAAGRRGLPRRRARAGRGDALVLRALRQGPGPGLHEQGLRAARSARGLDGRAGRCGRRDVARHEYTTIALSMLSDHLTATALSPTVRPQILARTRVMLKGGYGLLGEWLSEQDGVFTGTPPDAAAITFLKYDLPISSEAWMEDAARRIAACSSCPATTSAWTSTSASASPCRSRS